MDLDNMKYGDLQALAKSHGIKANQRAEKLIECLKKVLGSLKNVNKDKSSRRSASPKKTEQEAVQSESAVDENKSTLMKPKKQKNSENKSKPESTEISPSVAQSSMVRRSSLAGKVAESSPSPSKQAAALKPMLPSKTPSPKSRSLLNNKSSGTKLSVSKPEAKSKTLSAKKESAGKEIELKVVRGSSQKKENKSKKRILEISTEEEKYEPMRKKLRSSAENTKQHIVVKKQVGDNPSSNIPRYVRPVSSKKMEKKTFDADYWSKVHQKNQEKMESIDEYQKKKQDRAKLLMSGKKSSMTQSRASARKSPRLLAVSSVQKVFIPEVTTIDKVDFNFAKKSSGTKNETAHNITFTKIESQLLTPPTKSFRKNADKVAADSTAKRKSMFSPKPSHNNTLTNSVARTKFDLAASLDKPLTWVPYKGKVKPLSVQDEDDAKYVKKNRLRTDPKEVQLRSKQEKRAETRSVWKSKRDTLVMNKRSVK